MAEKVAIPAKNKIRTGFEVLFVKLNRTRKMKLAGKSQKIHTLRIGDLFNL